MDRKAFIAEVQDLVELSSDEVFEDVIISPASKSSTLTLEERFGKLEIFKKPLRLIYTDADNKITIQEKVLEQISCIDAPLNVVAVCGLYRTGKSYLMNRLANEKTGFVLGSTVNSETKGIWAWCKPHPKQKEQVLLLLDTEGIGDVKKGDSTHDNKMFSLTLLLSSTLIYNNSGVFNQETLDKLAFITKLTENIKVVSSEDCTGDTENSISVITPMFVMCLRDFYLELSDAKGKNITPDQYLEQSLLPSKDSEKESYNQTRECIKRYFPKRKCFTICMPTTSRNLSRVETLQENKLDEDFVKDVKQLQDFIYDCEPKLLDAVTKKRLDGFAFESFTRTYVKAFESESTLTFEKAFEQASRYHNSKLVVKLAHEFRSDIQDIQLPKKTKKSLDDECFILMTKKLITFREQAYPYKSEFFEAKAVAKMRVFCQEKQDENVAVVQALFMDTLQKMYKDLKKREKRYNTKEGLELLKQDLETMEINFIEKMKEYDRDEQTTAIVNFKRNIKEDKMRVSFRARMHEEKERNDKLRKEVQDSLKVHFETQLEEMKKERVQAMKQELKIFQENLTERIGVEAVKKQSFFKKLQLLFS